MHILTPADRKPALPPALVTLFTCVFLAVLLRTAWLSDDAAITLRTVLNVTHGFGLRFNIAERVQTFTHPLWLLLLTIGYLVAGHLYLVTCALSIGCSLWAFWMAVTRALSPAQAMLAIVALLFSAAFVDFSTSGLENPLSTVLLVVLVAVYLNETLARGKWLALLWTLASLLYLTRPDNLLFALPMLAAACWRVKTAGTVVRAVALGSVPALAWTAFAVIYYGFPFPNTAYAKLGMGIDRGDLWIQGLLYLLDSIDRDPLTLTAAAFAIVIGFTNKGAARLFACGIALYLFYVISIGGDFMAGRFVAVPLFASVLLMTRLVQPANIVWWPSTAVLLIVGSVATHVPLWSNSRFGDAAPKPSGVVDERAMYFRDKSLVLARRVTLRDPDWPRAHSMPPRTKVLDTCGLMGATGLDFGPYAYLLDQCALADPLLARIPAVYDSGWRTGHYRRMVPAGYRESLETSTNVIEDPALREYYDRIRVITRSDRLWSAERLKTIVAMNLGRYDHLVNQTFYRHAGAIAKVEDLAVYRDEGTPGDAPGIHVLTGPLAVLVADRPGRRYLAIALESDDRYLLTFLKGPAIVSTLELGPIPQHRRKPGLATYVEDVPPGARERGFDTIVVAPVGGDNHYALGHLLVEGYAATDWRLYREVSARDGIAQK